MAYNPFDFFRQNQKILFAVLTVFIMIMFTLSWGANDFFQWFPKWLGTRSSGDVMAVVDGTKVRSSDLDEIQKHRRTANEFMVAAARTANVKLTAELTTVAPTVSEANRATITEFATLRQTNYIDAMWAQLLRDPQFANERAMQFVAMSQRDNIAKMRTALGKIASGNNPRTEDLDAARIAQALLAFDTAPPKTSLYFTDMPNEDRKDAMDFLLWRKKADQLGIRFTHEDVENLVDAEFLRFNKEERAKVLQAVADDKRGVNAAEVYGHLADEFRVRAAQQAVLGASFVRAGAPAAVSPDQSFARFKEATEPARWSVATLPVDAFLSQVPGAPTAQEMTDLFRKGQNTEPDPALGRPALKKPRELKVGWLELTGKEAYYKTAAAEALAKYDPACDLGHLLVVPFGGGALGPLAGVGVASVPDKALYAEYEKYKDAEIKKAAMLPAKPGPFEPHKTDTTAASLSRPEHAAMLVGLAAATPLTAGLPPQLRAEKMDDTHRVAAQLPALAPSLLGGAFAPLVLQQTVAQKDYPALVAPKPPVLAAMRGAMADRVRETFQMSTLPRGDLEKLMVDTSKAVADSPNDKKAGRDAAKKLIDDFVAARKLADLKQVGGSAGFADMYAVNRDPGLDRLRARFAGPHAALASLDGFGRTFFKDNAPAPRGQQPKEVDSQRFFTPRTYPEPSIGDLDEKSQYLTWLTEEVASVVPRVAADVKDKIEAEWRRMKARALAKDAAEKLAAEAAKLKPDAATLAREWPELAKAYGPVFPMPPRAGAQLVPNGKSGYGFEDYRWPEMFIKYRTEKMERDLLDNRNKPLGTTVVHADQPESAYYVFVLLDRTEQLPVDYAQVAYAPVPGVPNPAGEQLPALFAGQARRAAIDDALELLRSEYGYKDENPKLRDKQQN